MNIAVVYVYPQVSLRTYFPLAGRFATTWKQFPPGAEPHTLYVIGNGSEVPAAYREPFTGIPCVWGSHDNSGWDVGLFQWAAEHIPCDLLVCLGAPVHFYRTGWLDRIVDVYLNSGPGLYGCWGVPYRASDHIRTTAFWVTPELMYAYPFMAGSLRESRYAFEHGPNSITRWAEQQGFPPLMVTFDAVYARDQWANADGGAGKCLMFDQFTHAGPAGFTRPI